MASPEKNSQSRACQASSVFAPASGRASRKREVGRVEDAVLIPGEELAGPIPVAAGEVADAGRRVHGEVGEGIEPTGQATQVVLVAAEVAPHDPQLGVAGQHPVAGRQDRLLGRRALAEHVPLRVLRVVRQLRVPIVERQPGPVGLGEVGDERPVGLPDRLVDRQQGRVVGEEVGARLRPDRHADVLPDLHADRPVVEGLAEPCDRALGEVRGLEPAGVEGGGPGEPAAAGPGPLERGRRASTPGQTARRPRSGRRRGPHLTPALSAPRGGEGVESSPAAVEADASVSN